MRRVTVVAVSLILAIGALTVFRAEALPPVIDLDTTSADLTVFGADIDDGLGRATTGDINGDTIDDLIIGARTADPAGRTSAGETYVIYGGPSLPAIIDLNSTSADLTVIGEDQSDLFGSGVAAGDINGDTIDDLIVGATYADGPGTASCTLGGTGDRCLAGETYVIYGSPALPATIDLAATSADVTVFGEVAGDFLGGVAPVTSMGTPSTT